MPRNYTSNPNYKVYPHSKIYSPEYSSGDENN